MWTVIRLLGSRSTLYEKTNFLNKLNLTKCLVILKVFQPTWLIQSILTLKWNLGFQLKNIFSRSTFNFTYVVLSPAGQAPRPPLPMAAMSISLAAQVFFLAWVRREIRGDSRLTLLTAGEEYFENYVYIILNLEIQGLTWFEVDQIMF